MTKNFTQRTRVEGGTDRQNDAAEWPPFFAASMLQIFLVQASGAQGVFSKASSAKDTMLFEIGKTRFSSHVEFSFFSCQDKSYFLNPQAEAESLFFFFSSFFFWVQI